MKDIAVEWAERIVAAHERGGINEAAEEFRKITGAHSCEKCGKLSMMLDNEVFNTKMCRCSSLLDVAAWTIDSEAVAAGRVS